MVKYIAIERQYGSGGRAIAKKLSEECHIPCYGKEILEKAAENVHVPVKELEKYEEKAVNSIIYSVAMLGNMQSYDSDYLMKDGKLFVAEQMAIEDLAEKGRAIFLGRCAFKALKNVDGVVRVFIKSSVEERRRRAVEEYGIKKSEVDSTLKKFDKKRSSYYYVNTSKKWNDFKNYDIVLDSSSLGIDGCVNVLKGLINSFDKGE